MGCDLEGINTRAMLQKMLRRMMVELHKVTWTHLMIAAWEHVGQLQEIADFSIRNSEP